ncbi:N-acetylglucosaminyldiphosphodolichol N-acetylglucosaminyltransferase catalytic subunit alg13, partial [Tulasnella sp. 408]
MSPSTPKRVFVTVGSTKFDALIQQVLTDVILQTFCDNRFTDLVIQAGNSVLPASWNLVGEQIRREIGGLTVTVWKFKASLTEEIESADLVVSHAGSGTILDTLRSGKRLIVVPNNTLLDNHQTELAKALHERGHLIAATVESVHVTSTEP